MVIIYTISNVPGIDKTNERLSNHNYTSNFQNVILEIIILVKIFFWYILIINTHLIFIQNFI